MKKHFYSFMVVMFTAFSFALTSCGDDNEDPDDPNDAGSTATYVTVNGEQFVGDDATCDILYNTHIDFTYGKKGSSDPYGFPTIAASIYCDGFSPATASKGTALDVKGLTTFTYQTDVMEGYSCDEYVSGSVTFESYNATDRTIVFKLSNLKCKNTKGNTLTVNGTVKCEVLRMPQ